MKLYSRGAKRSGADGPVVDNPPLRHAREMALNRLAFGILIGIYFVASGARQSLLVVVVCYIAFGSTLFAWLRRQGRTPLKSILGCALISDLGVLSLCMHIDGRGDAALFPMFLWVIQGNGFRFGIKALFVAIGMACSGFAAVIFTTPYWHDQPALSFSLLASLVILPSYSSTLIRKLSDARAQAEEASRIKSMFLAATSHELRTPLNAILGSVCLIEESRLDEEQRSLVDAMRVGTQSLLSLIGSILDFSRIEAGLMPMSAAPLDLATLLVETRDQVAMQARVKSLQLSIHVGPDVPLLIVADRKHLLETLLNLAANAVKFTSTGGICLSVEVAAPEPGSKVQRLRFEVTDTGIGIAPDAQARIFELFSQADSSILDRFGGTGLGLAISRQLVTLMGGTIGVESRLGQGSSFWVTIDLVEAAALQTGSVLEEVPAEAVLATGTATELVAAGRAALLCDDPAVGEMIQAALHARGLAVRGITSLQGILSPPVGKPGSEILFLHRRDPDRDLATDCALLGRLDPQAVIPRILLSRAVPTEMPSAMLKRHFMTVLPIPATDAALARACHLAGTATSRQAVQRVEEASPDGRQAENLAGPRKLRVLIADDNDVNRRVLDKILKRSGHHVTMVEDGDQALDSMEAQEFDLVLMDINMPGMNGLEATRLFRLATPASPHLPIFALTADATLDTERRCVEAGMDGCILKPITPDRLISTINAYFAAGLQTNAGQTSACDPGVTRLADHPRFAATAPCLDMAVLAELRILGGSDFVAELLESFMADGKILLDRMDRAIETQDLTAFRFELHALYSGAANIGAAGLRENAAARKLNHATLGTTGRVVTQQLRHELAGIEREWNRHAAQQGQASGR